MNKQEFLNRLRAALNGRISPERVNENVNYYEEYINTQIRMGKSEQDVLASLGDPRLIARTIIETAGQGGQNAGYNGSANNSNTNYNNSYSGGYQHYQSGRAPKSFHIPGWLWAIIVILVMVMVFSTLFSVVSFLFPVLFPIIIVVFLVKLFRDWLN